MTGTALTLDAAVRALHDHASLSTIGRQPLEGRWRLEHPEPLRAAAAVKAPEALHWCWLAQGPVGRAGPFIVNGQNVAPVDTIVLNLAYSCCIL